MTSIIVDISLVSIVDSIAIGKELLHINTMQPTSPTYEKILARPTTHSCEVGDMPRIELYTPAERARRDASIWTIVQGVLAPVQFVVFLISLYLVIHFLSTGDGYMLATVSILVKTALLYTIMITGAIWEREVYGRYLFAPAFFWEDVVSMLVMALHTLYLVGFLYGWADKSQLMWLAIAAYVCYLFNAIQFIVKFRRARLSRPALGCDSTVTAENCTGQVT